MGGIHTVNHEWNSGAGGQGLEQIVLIQCGVASQVLMSAVNGQAATSVVHDDPLKEPVRDSRVHIIADHAAEQGCAKLLGIAGTRPALAACHGNGEAIAWMVQDRSL